MATVTRSRRFDADPAAVRAAIEDVEPFTRAAGFDEVARDGDTLSISRGMGLVRISLTLELLDDPDAALAYRQREGIFAEMTTRYVVTAVESGTEVTATTEFELGAPVVGSALDATVVSRQRARELEAQFDYLAETC